MTKNSNQYEYERVILPEGKNLYLEHIDYAFEKEKVRHSKHFHEMYELMLFDNINGSVWIDGVVHKMLGSFLVYVNPFAIHEYNWEGGTTSWFISQFNQEGLSQLEFAEPLPDFSMVVKLRSSELLRLRTLFSWYQELAQNSKLREQADVFTLILHYTRGLAENYGPSEVENAQASGRKFLPMLRYIESQNKYHVSVEEASKRCGLSRSHFLALFKQDFKITYHQFLVNRKINTAKMLLAEQDKNISEISRILEFKDPGYFIKVFKAEVGLTPRQFRSEITLREKNR